MPRGVTGMAQGAYWNPVKPKLMAANCDWNKSVALEKKTGAVIETAFVMMSCRMSLKSPFCSLLKPSACRHHSHTQQVYGLGMLPWQTIICEAGVCRTYCSGK